MLYLRRWNLLVKLKLRRVIDMTIDEAIARERQQAKEQRNHIGTWDEEYSKKCELYAEEHEQLVERLEELRELRVTVSELQCEMQATGALLNERDKETRNNAIDDFAEKLNAKCDGMIKDKWNSNVAPISWAEAYADFKDDIDEIAEQLKAGGENEI